MVDVIKVQAGKVAEIRRADLHPRKANLIVAMKSVVRPNESYEVVSNGKYKVGDEFKS